MGPAIHKPPASRGPKNVRRTSRVDAAVSRTNANAASTTTVQPAALSQPVARTSTSRSDTKPLVAGNNAATPVDAIISSSAAGID